jgi:hypothetical protein
MSPLRRLGLAVALALAVPSSADAQTPSTGREAARPFAEKGFERYEAGDCPAAKKYFEQAEEKFHAPPHRLFIARCNAKLGKLVAARDMYRELVAEKLAPDAPPPFRDAQTSAKSEVEEVEIRIPTLEVALAPSASGAHVTIDGAPVAQAELTKPKAMDPGPHTIVATSSDGARFERTVTLKDGGGSARVQVAFAGASAPASAGPELPAIITIAAGGAVIGLGAITGILSLNKVGELKDSCPNKRCPPSAQATADEAKTMGTISTIGFIVGGAAVAAGVTLLVWKPKFGGGGGSQQGRAAAPSTALRVGPSGAALVGRF